MAATENLHFPLISGLFSILTQLAAADIILLAATAGLELWSRNVQTWTFGDAGCRLYRGLDALSSTATLYLIITVALHALATANLEEKVAERRVRRNCEDDEMRSSRRSLMANSDSSTPPRTMQVDYMLARAVSVLPPSVFVWLLAISLSIPQFALATTMRLQDDTESCTFLDSIHRNNMLNMIAVFNLYLPTVILCAVIGLVSNKLRSRLFSDPNFNELKSALKLSLWLIATYCVLCVPRSILRAYIAHSNSSTNEETLYSSKINSRSVFAKVQLAVSCTYVLASLLRPLLSLCLLKKLRRMFLSPSNVDETDHV